MSFLTPGAMEGKRDVSIGAKDDVAIPTGSQFVHTTADSQENAEPVGLVFHHTSLPAHLPSASVPSPAAVLVANTHSEEEIPAATSTQPCEACCWVFTVCRGLDFDSPGKHRLVGMSLEDKHYAESNYRTQRIALRFSHMLDPTIVTQALHLAISEYPRVGSRLVMYEGAPKYHLEAAEINVRVITVAPRVLLSDAVGEWEHVCESMAQAKKGGFGRDASPLFEACLLASHDSTAGCILVAGFQHVLGDATSYAMFLRSWSDIYAARLQHSLRSSAPNSGQEAAAAASAAAVQAAAAATEAAAQAAAILDNFQRQDSKEATVAPHASGSTLLHKQERAGAARAAAEEHQSAHAGMRSQAEVSPLACVRMCAPQLPKGVFRTPMPPRPPPREDACGQPVVVSRRFAFSAQSLGDLKSRFLGGNRGRSGTEGSVCKTARACSTNDLLVAQFACAIAPFRIAALRAACGASPMQPDAQAEAEASSGGCNGWGSEPINTSARIVLLADHRGRGAEAESWGNHSVDISVHVSYSLLLSGDVAAVALAIRGGVAYELHKLEHDLALYNYQKRLSAGTPKLFLWNSWARVGHRLREASFGGCSASLVSIEWLNMLVLDASQDDTIVAVSPSHAKGLTVAVSSGTASRCQEMLAVEAAWSQAQLLPDQRPHHATAMPGILAG